MQSQAGSRLPLAVRVAHAVSRLLTWGMAGEERRHLLSETLADWEAMSHDHRSGRILWRAIKGIPAAIWVRLDRRSITAMPAGVALTMVGFGAIAASVQDGTLPSPFNEFAAVTAAGLVLVGVNFVREPRRITVRRYRPAALASAIGFGGLAFTLPAAETWPYDTPLIHTPVIDRGMQLSFALIALGFLLLLAATRHNPKLIRTAGLVLMIGCAGLGITQVAWGIVMSPIDLDMTAASIVIGLGALSFVHVLPRLRHLEVVYSKAEASRHDVESLRKGEV